MNRLLFHQKVNFEGRKKWYHPIWYISYQIISNNNNNQFQIQFHLLQCHTHIQIQTQTAKIMPNWAIALWIRFWSHITANCVLLVSCFFIFVMITVIGRWLHKFTAKLMVCAVTKFKKYNVKKEFFFRAHNKIAGWSKDTTIPSTATIYQISPSDLSFCCKQMK